MCPPPRIRAGCSNQSGKCAPERQQGWSACRESSTQQQQPVSNQCSPLAPVTGTHTPSAMDIGQPQAEPAPGWSLLACRGRPTLCPPLLPPPNKQQHDEILTHRFQHRESSRCHRRSSQQQLCHLPISLFCPPSFPLPGQRSPKRNAAQSASDIGESSIPWRRQPDGAVLVASTSSARGRSQDEETAPGWRLGIWVVLIGFRHRPTLSAAA